MSGQEMEPTGREAELKVDRDSLYDALADRAIDPNGIKVWESATSQALAQGTITMREAAALWATMSRVAMREALKVEDQKSEVKTGFIEMSDELRRNANKAAMELATARERRVNNTPDVKVSE